MNNLDQIRDSLGKFYLAVNPSYKYVAYQQERLAPALEAVERGETKRLMINMGPGFAKSDWATRTFVPWWLGRHPDKNVLVGSYSASLASDDFGARIKARMQTPLYQKLFPRAKLTHDSRGRTKFTTVSGGTFYSVGFEGSWTGKRLDLALIDDLVQSYAVAESETIQDALFADYKGMIKDRMTANGAIVICAHRWTTRDVYGRILEFDGTVDKGGAWTVLKLPAEDPPDSGNYLWLRPTPEEPGFPLSFYLDFKRDEKIWWSKFQQNPSGYQKGRMFKADWLRYHDLSPSPGQYKAYLICDPGGTKEKKSDKTSAQLFLALDGKRLMLADWVHDKLDPGERQTKLSRMINYWQPEINLYEELGMVSDSFFFNRAQEEKGFDAILTPVGRKGPRHLLSKEQRIEGLQPRYRESRIILPRKFWYTNSSGEKLDLTKRFLEEEYNVYMGKGSVAHEDDLDCQSRLDDIEPPYGPGFEWYVPDSQRPPPLIKRVAQSWEVAF